MTVQVGQGVAPTWDPRCGSSAGYQAHRRRHERTCEPCREANNQRNRKHRQGKKTSLPPTDSMSCGTSSGAARHSRRGERMCDPCRIARLETRRDRLAGPPPPRPGREALEAAACYPAVEVSPGVMLHDNRYPGETDHDWQARLAAARAVCRHCPVRAACKQLDAHYAGRREGVDGILAGEPTSSPLYNRKDKK